MSGWLYLIRNKDLYKIGITKNFENRMQKLKPDSIVLRFYTNDYIILEKYLHNRYKKFRIPQTEYFRLKKIHLKEIKKIISEIDYPISINLDIFIRSLLLLCLIFFFVCIFTSLKINELNLVFIKSLYVMERISIALSIFYLFRNSRKNLSFWNELKFRTLRLIVFILFSFIFRIANVIFN